MQLLLVGGVAVSRWTDGRLTGEVFVVLVFGQHCSLQVVLGQDKTRIEGTSHLKCGRKFGQLSWKPRHARAISTVVTLTAVDET